MHPSPEQLIAYRTESLRPEEEDTVRAHLVDCDACAGLLLDLADLETSGPETVSIPPSEMESAWEAQRRLQSPPPPQKWEVFRLSGWAVAACLAVLMVYQFSQLQTFKRKHVEAYKEDLPLLFAAPADVRTTNGLPPFDIVEGKPSFLVLPVLPQEDGIKFRVDFYFEDRLLLSRESLSSHRDHLFLVIPPDRLPAGDIRVSVSETGEGYTPEDFFFEVRHLKCP